MKTIFHLQFCCYSSTLTRIVIGQFFVFVAVAVVARCSFYFYFQR